MLWCGSVQTSANLTTPRCGVALATSGHQAAPALHQFLVLGTSGVDKSKYSGLCSSIFLACMAIDYRQESVELAESEIRSFPGVCLALDPSLSGRNDRPLFCAS